MASPRGGAAAGRDLQSALAAVEAHLQQLLLNSSSGLTAAANVCDRFSVELWKIVSDSVRMINRLKKAARNFVLSSSKHK